MPSLFGFHCIKAEMEAEMHAAHWLVVLSALLVLGCGSQPGPTAGESVHEEPAEDGTQIVPSEHAAGERIYQGKCALCHDDGEAGAPRLGNPRQWSKRAGQSVEQLTSHAFDGFEGTWGEMPAQGGDLSRDEIEQAVRYMLYRYQAADSETH